jgi:hypothetical protein
LFLFHDGKLHVGRRWAMSFFGETLAGVISWYTLDFMSEGTVCAAVKNGKLNAVLKPPVY